MVPFLLRHSYSFLGNLYISDTTNARIRKITASTSIISTKIGTGTASYSGDNGQATSATINNPSGVAVDTSGECYMSLHGIADRCLTNYSSLQVTYMLVITEIIVSVR